jgi:hypothetical protein
MARTRGWKKAAFFESLAGLCSPESLEGAKRLVDAAQARALELRPGGRVIPTINIRFEVLGVEVTVLWLSAWPGSNRLLGIYFGNLIDKGVSLEVVRGFAERLSPVSEIRELLPKLEAAGYRKWPHLQVDPVLGRPGAVETIVEALDELLGTRARAQ